MEYSPSIEVSRNYPPSDGQRFKSYLMQEAGAEFVHISYNDTGTYDYERALPPHSMRVTIQGGNDELIGRLIYQERRIGVKTVGDTSIVVKDSQGFSHTEYFERGPFKKSEVKSLFGRFIHRIIFSWSKE